MLIFIILLFLLVEPYIVVPQTSGVCFNTLYGEGTTLELFTDNSYNRSLLSNIEKCAVPRRDSNCNLIRSENNELFSIGIYYCLNAILEDELYILLDDEDNSRTKEVIAVMKDNIIAIAKKFYFSLSSEELSSEEGYISYSDE